DRPGIVASDRGNGWNTAAGAARRTILCPKRGYTFATGIRPFFGNLSGSVKGLSRGGEGTLLSLHGHLRIPSEATLWEFYSRFKMWDKVELRFDYTPWSWASTGHVATDGNFAGLILTKDEAITTNLNVTTFKVGADYDVSFSRDLIFGPNADLHVMKWAQRISTDAGGAADLVLTILEPSIGAHLRYEPANTGYFSWFKPFMEARFGWMSLGGLGLSTWDMCAGIAPPVSRNVDAGLRVGYKQLKLDGQRDRLFADVAVEGLYLDLSLRF
ncbi:hypothetical protein ACFL2Q_16270, partial [Thermodesulfobacteriota bacterium]